MHREKAHPMMHTIIEIEVWGSDCWDGPALVYRNAAIVPEPLAGEGQTPRGPGSAHEPGPCCVGATCGFLYGLQPGPLVASSHKLWWTE